AFRNAMLDRRNITRLWERLALRLRDGYHRHITEGIVDATKFGQIQSSVQGCNERHPGSPQDGVAEVVDVEMNDIELLGSPCHDLQRDDMRSEIVTYPLVETQRTWPNRLQLRLGHAIAAGKQRHFVAEAGELIGEIGDDPLGAAIELGWHGLHQR